MCWRSYRYRDDSGSGIQRSYVFGDLRYDISSAYLKDPRDAVPETSGSPRKEGGKTVMGESADI